MRTQPPVYSPLPVSAVLAAHRAGPEAVPQLEALLLREYAAERVLLTGSGTQALQVAITAALAAVRGDMVALPAFSCYDVASAALGAGARITFYDLDSTTLAPDQASLRQAFQRGAGAAVVAPLYGIPVPWADLESLARDCSALLIEDAAQGHGASWAGRPLGSHGRLAVLSFGRGKGWTAGGGGALLGRNEGAGLVPAALPPGPGRGLAHTGRCLAQSLLARPRVFAFPRALPWLGLGQTLYREPTTPTAMDPAVAALALATRPLAAAEAALRRQRAQRMLAALPDGVRAIRADAASVAGYLRLPILAPAAAAARLLESLGHAGVAPGYPALLSDLPEIQHAVEAEPGIWPGAATLLRQLLTLPAHSLLEPAEADELVQRIAD